VVPAVPQRCLLPWGRIASRHIGETDCMAGVVGLELRNPLGSKSARIAAGSSGDLAETARQRLFTFELRCGGHAAAARISAGVAARGLAHFDGGGWSTCLAGRFRTLECAKKIILSPASFCARLVEGPCGSTPTATTGHKRKGAATMMLQAQLLGKCSCRESDRLPARGARGHHDRTVKRSN
jgi:hypothetical protein